MQFWESMWLIKTVSRSEPYWKSHLMHEKACWSYFVWDLLPDHPFIGMPVDYDWERIKVLFFCFLYSYVLKSLFRRLNFSYPFASTIISVKYTVKVINNLLNFEICNKKKIVLTASLRVQHYRSSLPCNPLYINYCAV